MKKSIKNFADKKIQNSKAIKGGGFGKGTKKAAFKARSRSKLQ